MNRNSLSALSIVKPHNGLSKWSLGYITINVFAKKYILLQFLFVLILNPIFAENFQSSECLKKDLCYIHSIIKEDFSGYADSEVIRKNINAKYEKLQKTIESCNSKVDYVKAIKEYFASLHDPHIQPIWNYSKKYCNVFELSTGKAFSGVRFDYVEYVSVGIILKKLNNQIFVDKIDPSLVDSQIKVKPGAELISCDGKKALDILNNEILPYESVTGIEAAQYKHAAKIFIRWDKNPGSITECQFKQAGNIISQKLKWKTVDKNYIEKFHKTAVDPIYEMIDKPYGKWLKLKTLAGYDEDTIKLLKKFVADAAKLRSEKILVLDIRGNGGGNSSWGTQWIKALYGDSVDIPTPSNKVWASQRNVAHYERFFAGLAEKETSVESDIKERKMFIDSLKNKLGEFVPVCGSATESLSHGSKISKNFLYNGKLYVVIDWRNFSSAEIFIQELKAMPGVKLIGLSTDASTIYGDIRFEVTPSGLMFTVPTKVFFKSFHDRKSGESILPHIRVKYDVEEELLGKDSIMRQVDLLIQNEIKKN